MRRRTPYLVELGRDLVHERQLGTGNPREVVVLHVIPCVHAEEVQDTVVRVRLLPFGKDVVFGDEVARHRV